MRTERGTDIARRLERLLETFPHPDGSPWRGAEIEQETGGVVSQSYFSSLRKGRINRPGAEQLRAIAEVMDFPLELWHAESDQWPRILQHRMYQTSASGSGSGSRSLRQNFHTIRRTVPNPKTKAPYTYEEISEHTGGEISAEQVMRIAEGENDNPDYATIVALSAVFNVSTDYWYAIPANRGPILDTELLDALGADQGRDVLRRWHRLSGGRRSMLLNVLENLEELEAEESPTKLIGNGSS